MPVLLALACAKPGTRHGVRLLTFLAILLATDEPGRASTLNAAYTPPTFQEQVESAEQILVGVVESVPLRACTDPTPFSRPVRVERYLKGVGPSTVWITGDGGGECMSERGPISIDWGGFGPAVPEVGTRAVFFVRAGFGLLELRVLGGSASDEHLFDEIQQLVPFLSDVREATEVFIGSALPFDATCGSSPFRTFPVQVEQFLKGSGSATMSVSAYWTRCTKDGRERVMVVSGGAHPAMPPPGVRAAFFVAESRLVRAIPIVAGDAVSQRQIDHVEAAIRTERGFQEQPTPQ